MPSPLCSRTAACKGILDNVRLGRPQTTRSRGAGGVESSAVHGYYEKFPAGIHASIGTKGVYLAGGEQQRIAIARAMLKNAPILILDEATAFAGRTMKLRCRQPLPGLPKAKPCCDDAHRLSTVASADCIYVVQDGQCQNPAQKGRAVRAERSVCPDVAGVSAIGAVEGRKGGVKMIEKIQHATASSRRRAQEACKGVLACAFRIWHSCCPPGCCIFW